MGLKVLPERIFARLIHPYPNITHSPPATPLTTQEMLLMLALAISRLASVVKMTPKKLV